MDDLLPDFRGGMTGVGVPPEECEREDADKSSQQAEKVTGHDGFLNARLAPWISGGQCSHWLGILQG